MKKKLFCIFGLILIVSAIATGIFISTLFLLN